jgi:hypothetical protein
MSSKGWNCGGIEHFQPLQNVFCLWFVVKVSTGTKSNPASRIKYVESSD